MVSLEALLQNEYVVFLLFIVGFAAFGYVFNFVLRTYVLMLTRKTETDIDDIILDIVMKPLYVFILGIGFYVALQRLSILQPYGLHINRIFFVFTVISFSYLLSRIFGILLSRWLKVKKRFQKTPRLLNKIVSIIIYLVAALMILSYFEIEITPMIATLGLGGVAIGLALQNTMTNFFAGLHILSDRPIDVGHYVQFPGAEGYVEDIGWRSTRIRTRQNTYLIVPNAKLAESIVLNYALPLNQTNILVKCGVAYGSDLKKVETVTLAVARHIQRTVDGASKNYQPLVRYHTFGDSNIDFTVWLAVETFEHKWFVEHEFIKALKERYDKENIEISWPVRKMVNAK
jgi:small-conductance mechanosensitive channel